MPFRCNDRIFDLLKLFEEFGKSFSKMKFESQGGDEEVRVVEIDVSRFT